MRTISNIIAIISLVSIAILSSCGEDVQLPNKILQGEINGSEWEFAVGKALSNQSQRNYKAELFSFTGYSEDEGCLLFGGTSRYFN